MSFLLNLSSYQVFKAHSQQPNLLSLTCHPVALVTPYLLKFNHAHFVSSQMGSSMSKSYTNPLSSSFHLDVCSASAQPALLRSTSVTQETKSTQAQQAQHQHQQLTTNDAPGGPIMQHGHALALPPAYSSSCSSVDCKDDAACSSLKEHLINIDKCLTSLVASVEGQTQLLAKLVHQQQQQQLMQQQAVASSSASSASAKVQQQPQEPI